MAKNDVSKDAYLSEVQAQAKAIRAQSERLAQIARYLDSAPDFSPETVRLITVALKEMGTAVTACKAASAISVARGNTCLNEELVCAARSIAAKKVELANGTLRLNRRVSDMAAE